MKPPLILILFIFFSFTAIGQQTKKFGGIYSYGDTIPDGILYVYPESDSTLLFDILIVNSNYHIGNNAGRIKIKHDSAIYENFNENDFMACRLLFKFKPKEVIIKTLNGHYDCGYGYGVFSDGIYLKQKDKIPEYYFNGEGDTLYFKEFNKHQNDSL
jgi:hypothetical protein